MKKYAVYPGKVFSQTDGDEHFISAQQLMRLYGVHRSECVIVNTHRPGYTSTSDSRATEDLIALFPQYDGDYNSPDK